MIKLSNSAYQIDGQPMFKVLDRVQELEREGKKILHFELGDPDFDTPTNIVDAGIESLRNGDTHYINSMGLLELRECIVESTIKSRGFKPDISQILITPGANAIIYYAIRCIVNEGEEVIVPDPGFPTYFSAIKFCGAKAVPVPLREKNKHQLKFDDVKKLITEKTKLIIINSPSNPTGSVMDKNDISKIYELCYEKGIFILSDEIYSRSVFKEQSEFYSPSMIDHCNNNVLILNGFSKAFAMTGWRIGIAIGPQYLIEKMGLLLQTINSCVPPFIQKAAVEAINGDQTKVRMMKNEYAERRKVLVKGLNSIDGIRCHMPSGSIYAFPNVSELGMTGEEFVDLMLEKAGIALLPGSSFGQNADDFVRMCYVNSIENIQLALGKMKDTLKNRR
ncbi:pyridoxal phosphate-dependent aminotransferase [Candidatus Pseudothioglobus sp. Uisw_086]|uniref:pyridoxal phosphate-dependent aminotransferase n=1 Tax=Candidatus Pseudothioglobus sp. Uisw_086 TaxID=3230998 RepID=UPI003A8484D2